MSVMRERRNRLVVATVVAWTRALAVSTVGALMLAWLAAWSAVPLVAQSAGAAAFQRATAARETATFKRVAPNRTVPRVTAPVFNLTFAAEPTTDDISGARFFPEPLLPVGREPSPAENAVVARSLERYVATTDDVARLEVLREFASTHAASPWRAAVMAQLGALYAGEGYFSRAADLWNQSWQIAKAGDDLGSRAVADYALGEGLSQAVKFGQVDWIASRLKEIESRNVRGPAGQKVREASQGLYLLINHHETAVFSGPAALKALLRATAPTPNLRGVQLLEAYKPSHQGTTLTELADLGARAGMPVRMVHLASIGGLPLPAVVHLRSEHFSAVIARRDGGYLLQDPALGGEFWMSEAALEDEASGYLLVPAPTSVDDGRVVTADEGGTVVGHCQPGMPAANEPCGCGGPGSGGPGGGGPGGGGPGGPGSGMGMPSYALHPVAASVILRDTPVGYTPPVGPDVHFRIFYNHRVDPQPQTPFFGGLGAMWEFNWQSYIVESIMLTAPYAARVVHLRDEGVEFYHSYSPPTHWRSRAALVQVSSEPAHYERRLPDGTVEVFALADRPASVAGRHIFLTEVIDPQGQRRTFTYDAGFRLVAVTDAVGQVTTLQYLDSAHPFAVTRVTDPFGRFATLTYDALGRLSSVTDVIGLTSTFVYGLGDFIASMTTPYGTTAFRRESSGGVNHFVEATDPLGGTERVEFVFDGPGSDAVPAAEVPTGFSTWNTFMDRYTSYYWDKRAMALYPGDTTKAVATSWNMASDTGYDHATSRNIPHSLKRPLESRLWFRYPNQTSHHAAGTGLSPSEVARVLDDGTTQRTLATYNAQGLATSRTDALNRQTTFVYAPNGIDLLEVRQVTPGGTDLLASYASYSAQHLPGTMADGATQSTTTTYNAVGQPLTVTNAKGETTTYVYDSAGSGELQSVTGPVTGATTDYTYDSFGRIRTVTHADGYTVTTDYDLLDRVTRRTYPDGTYDQFIYDRLDLVEQRDRLGRITRHLYDALGRRTATRDPAGRTITQVWCDCGSLDALVDANGNRTAWERDVQGRVTREVRADGTTDTQYTYDLIGRLTTVTDPKDQVTTYTYALDDALLATGYTNAQVATPSVSYTYDLVYPRITTMVDGIGTTSYTYQPTGTLGAGQVAAIDGPFVDDTIAYVYDQLGRVTTRAINGAANTVTWAFDPLGRVTNETSVLGAFDYTYDGVTNRLSTVSYPNGQTSAYSYLPTNQDHRLQTIHHQYPNGATLSKFDYTYDVVGNIQTWRQQAEMTAVMWKYGYDAADQLTRAVKHATDVPETTLQRYAYAYDPAGNRTVEQIDDAVMLSSYDTLNRLTAQAPGGPLVVAGTLDEPGTVTIAGAPAVVDVTNAFRGTVPTVAGPNTLTIVARDASGNQTTQAYQVNVAGTARTFTYDANGNLTADGTRTLEWNARDQLIASTVNALRTDYQYDGISRRVRLISPQTTPTEITWCGGEVCEERGSGSQVLVLRHGQRAGGAIALWTTDHLGSIREEVSMSAVVVSRNSYEPFGSTVSGPRGFAFHGGDPATGLDWTWLRAYDPKLGRWLSEDPAGSIDGPNLYSYVQNRPTRFVDLFGLRSSSADSCAPCTPYVHMDKVRACILVKHSQPDGVGAVAACTVLSLLGAPSVIAVGAGAAGCAALSAWYIQKRCIACATFCDEMGAPACSFINQGPEEPVSPLGPEVHPPQQTPRSPGGRRP